MRRYGWWAVALLLAIGIHVDWHLARPHHHRLSLAWHEHWIFALALFGLVGLIVARFWPVQRWRVGAWVLGIAVLVAQGLEPLLESVFYDHRLGYVVEPERWAAFAVCLAVGIPVYALALWLCAPPVFDLRPST